MVKENGGVRTSGQHGKRAPMRRGNSRSSICTYGAQSKVTLEQVLGVSATSNNSLSYDPTNERVLYTAGCVCVVYDIKKGKQFHITNDAKKPLTCAAFSSDGNFIVTGESGHQPCVRVWDPATGAQLKELQGHGFGISSVAFSPSNPKVIVSVGFTHDSNVFVWNWKTGKQVAGNKMSSRVYGMSYNEKGNYFVLVGVRFVKFWYFDSNDDKALTRLSPCENRAAILDTHKNTTFKSVVCGKGPFSHLTFCLSNEGRLYSFGESRRVERWLDLKVNGAYALHVTSKLLLCACSDGVVRVFEPASLSYLVSLPKPHPLGVNLAECTSASSVAALAASSEYPDSVAVVADPITNKVVVLYRDKSLYIWDMTDLQMIGKCRSYLFHSACICTIEVYPQQDLMSPSKLCLPKGTFVTGSSDNTIKIWNLNFLDPLDPVMRNVYSKELLNQIYTDNDYTWLRTSKVNAPTDNANGVTAISVSPDGELVASGDKKGDIRVHDLVDLCCDELVRIEAHDAEILSISFTRSNSAWFYLVSASRDRLIHVFDVRNNYERVQTISDHSAIVTSVKFVEKPGDTLLTLLSCSADKSVRFRSGFKSGREQLQFQTYQYVQEKSTFNDMEIPNSRDRVIAGCQDRQIRTYDISSGKMTNSFKSGTTDNSGMIINVALDPSGTLIAAAGSDKCIFVHDASTGEKLASLFGHSEMITGLKFTNDCKRLISTSGDGCIFVWRLSKELEKSIRNKARGQGYSPEPGVDTPLVNKRTGALSPHNEYAIPILDLLQEPVDRTSPVPPSSPTPFIKQETPERARKKWEKPTSMAFLTLADLNPLTPDSCKDSPTVFPNQPTVQRTAPDGGEEEEGDALHLNQVNLEEGEAEAGTRVSVEVSDLSGSDLDETNSCSPPEDYPMFMLPKCILSPNTSKRMSHRFDVIVTPEKKPSVGEEVDPGAEGEEEEEVELGGIQDEEDNEKDVRSDSFIRHKFEEIDDNLLDEDQLSTSLSPGSRHRLSMSRKSKPHTPEKLQKNHEVAPETPRSKGSSPLNVDTSNGQMYPDRTRVHLVVEGKLEDKRRQKHIVLGARSHVQPRSRKPSNERENLLRAVTAVDITVEPPPEESFMIRRPSGKRPDTKRPSPSLARAGSNRSIDYTGRSDTESLTVGNPTQLSDSSTADKSGKVDKEKKETSVVKAKSKNKLNIFGKNKDEKSEPKVKEDKTKKSKDVVKKARTPMMGRKAEQKNDPLSDLQKSFKECLIKFDSLSKEKRSNKTSEELAKYRNVLSELHSNLESALGSGNKAAAAHSNGAIEQGLSPAQLAEIGSQVVGLVQQKLDNS